MRMDETLRLQRIAETREAASAFVEDYAHIAELLARPGLQPPDVRRASAILRRLLIDNGGGDLRRIAPPRTGRVAIPALDVSEIRRIGSREPVAFWAAGGATVFGVQVQHILAMRGHRTRLGRLNPDRMVALDQDGFLAQQVMCFEGQWVKRRDILKYVANIASGVHSDRPREEVDRLISRIRHVISLTANDEQGVGINFNEAAIFRAEPGLALDRRAFDPVLLEVVATMTHVSASPDLQGLGAAIRRELDGP